MRKNALALLFRGCILLTVLCGMGTPSYAVAQTDSGTAPVHVLFPGTTKTIDLRQADLFPFGCPLVLVFACGSGQLDITLSKQDSAGDIIFMLGAAASRAGRETICRLGVSEGLIHQSVDIGTPAQPHGLIVLWGGIAASERPPYYTSQLILSFTP